MSNFPFTQIIDGERIVRTFLPSVDSDELKWHRDAKDRKVRIIESGGWEFQTENELPVLLENEMTFFIPKMSWHRVIVGHDNLVVEIEELD